MFDWGRAASLYSVSRWLPCPCADRPCAACQATCPIFFSSAQPRAASQARHARARRVGGAATAAGGVAAAQAAYPAMGGRRSRARHAHALGGRRRPRPRPRRW